MSRVYVVTKEDFDELVERVEAVESSSFVVVNAGTALDAERPDAAAVYWLFDNGVAVGDDNENVVNLEPQDLVYVAAA